MSTDTFTTLHLDGGERRLHAVIGGIGPPLLLVHGSAATGPSWRLPMRALARDFAVVAVERRGPGRREGPGAEDDPGGLADDLIGLMDALGHPRFAVVGHGTGLPIARALAAGHPDRIARVALGEIFGIRGAADAPPRIVPAPVLHRR